MQRRLAGMAPRWALKCAQEISFPYQEKDPIMLVYSYIVKLIVAFTGSNCKARIIHVGECNLPSNTFSFESFLW